MSCHRISGTRYRYCWVIMAKDDARQDRGIPMMSGYCGKGDILMHEDGSVKSGQQRFGHLSVGTVLGSGHVKRQ